MLFCPSQVVDELSSLLSVSRTPVDARVSPKKGWLRVLSDEKNRRFPKNGWWFVCAGGRGGERGPHFIVCRPLFVQLPFAPTRRSARFRPFP